MTQQSPQTRAGRIDASIIICTWNRCVSLRRALESMRRMHIPEGLNWELIVVDNGSTDDTQQVIADYLALLPLRCVCEPRAGVAHARDCGLHHARGALTLWTDDDVEVDENWLAQYCAAAQQRPDAAFWGGTIKPQFELPPPAWIKQAWPVVASIYGERDFADSVFEIRELAQFPFGGNYAVCTVVHRRYSYDTRLGRKRDTYIGGEETNLIQRMLAGGHRGWWCSGAKVIHWIPPEHATLEYLARYWRGAGEHSGITAQSRMQALRILSHTLNLELRYRRKRLAAPPPVWVQAYLKAQYQWGLLGQARGKRLY